MSIRGTIKGNLILLDGPTGLPDGTEVRVEPVPVSAELGQQPTTSRNEQSISELLLSFAGIMKGEDLPADGSMQVDHYVYGTPKR